MPDMPISPRPARDTTGPPRPSVVVSITPAPYRSGPGRPSLRSGEAVDLVHVSAGDAERGVVLADGVLLGPLQQAVHRSAARAGTARWPPSRTATDRHAP